MADNHNTGGKVASSAAGMSIHVGIKCAKWIFFSLIGGLLVHLWWTIFPSKGVTFAGMDASSKGTKALKHIVKWGVKRKYIAYPAAKDPLSLAQHIRANLIPVLPGHVVPVDKRRMKDKATWDHIESVLRSHGIPFVII